MLNLKKLFLLRKITRKLGLNPLLFRLLYGNKSYEQYFDNKFSSSLVEGDIVLDIGANVGFYTKDFAKIVSGTGLIFAIEPSEINFNKLKETSKNFSNIIPLNLAIGSKNDKLFISQGEDELGANSRISNIETKNGKWVDVLTIDDLVKMHKQPSAIKIDVEGFEIEVLKGSLLTLKSKTLRMIGIEVHTSILHENGINNGPEQIEQILISNGFKIEWTDFSHIVATR
jgi:FkbM family methyltransferase